MQVETPLGRDVLPNPRVVERAEKEDLNKPLTYQVGGVAVGGQGLGPGAGVCVRAQGVSICAYGACPRGAPVQLHSWLPPPCWRCNASAAVHQWRTKPLQPCYGQRARALTSSWPFSTTTQVAFVRNREAKVVYDRRFNTAALMKEYYGDSVDFTDRWADRGQRGCTGQGQQQGCILPGAWQQQCCMLCVLGCMGEWGDEQKQCCMVLRQQGAAAATEHCAGACQPACLPTYLLTD